MKRIFTLVILLFVFINSYAQGNVAKFTIENFDVNATAGQTFTTSTGSAVAETGDLTAGSLISAFHTSALTVYSTPAGNVTANALSSNNWSVADYYQFKVATTGFQGIKLLWDQTGSSTGPAQFKVQYSTVIGGASGYVDFMNYVVPNNPLSTPTAGAAYAWSATVATNPANATSFTADMSSLTALNGKTEVYFRLVCTNATTSVTGVAVATTGTNRIDNITVTYNSILPIELTSFTAKSNNSTTKLYWQTASEKNNSHFAIEHSVDGDVFSKIGEVKGNGNSTITQNYQYTDVTPTKGINYYRLRQVDFDGTESVSKTVSVNFDSKVQNKVKIYPTLVKDAVSVELSDDSKAEIAVRDLTGRVILTQNTEGVSNTTLNLGALSSGLYILSVRSNFALETVKIYKQ
jgi:Secretion system C-terminal sorting domain